MTWHASFYVEQKWMWKCMNDYQSKRLSYMRPDIEEKVLLLFISLTYSKYVVYLEFVSVDTDYTLCL